MAVETFLGEKPRFEQCLTMTNMLDQMERMGNDTKHLLIDCMSGIVHTLMLNKDVSGSINQAMQNLGDFLNAISARVPGLRIYVANPVSRKSNESKLACSQAVVYQSRFISKYTYLLITILCCRKCSLSSLSEMRESGR